MQPEAQAKSTDAMDEFRQFAKSNPQLAMSALLQLPATHPLIAQGVSVLEVPTTQQTITQGVMHQVPATNQTITPGASMHQGPAVDPPIAQGIIARSHMGESPATNRCPQCGGKIRSSPVRAWTGPLARANLAVNPGNQVNLGN